MKIRDALFMKYAPAATAAALNAIKIIDQQIADRPQGRGFQINEGLYLEFNSEKDGFKLMVKKYY